MFRFVRSVRWLPWLVFVAACGVEDYGKDLPVTQVPVDPPPPPPSPGALSLVVEGARIRGVAGGTSMVKVHVPDRATLASVLTITLESPPPGFSMAPANLAVGADAITLSLRTSISTPVEPEILTFALTSVRGEEGRVSVPAEVAGRPGTQDSSFFTDPRVVKLGASLPAIVVDAVGRTVVSGTEAPPPQSGELSRTGVARLLSTGGLDYGFGNEVGSLGIVHFTPKPALQNETVQAISVDATSRVYGAVLVQDGAGPSYVQRLQSNGQVDTTFGSGGSVRFSDFSAAYGVVTDRDGVVTCGREWQSNRYFAFLRRFLADGKKDPSFASDWLSLDTRVTSVQHLVRTPGGRFAFVGTSATGWLVFLAEVDGVPVSTFGNGGTVLLPFDGVLTGLAATDDAVYVYGAKNTGGRKGRIVKLGRDGVRDPSFGTPGEPAGELVSTTTQSIARVVVDGSGRLLSVGRIVAGSAALLERWLPTGKPDTGFGNGGRVQFAGVSDDFQSVTVRPNGRILTVHRITSTVPTLQVTQFWD